MKKNFPSDWNFKGNNYWYWKAARISELTLLFMRSLKNVLGKPSLLICSRSILSSDTAASSNCDSYSLKLENWYPVTLFACCSGVFPCKGIALLLIQRETLLEIFSCFCWNLSSGGYPSGNNVNICSSISSTTLKWFGWSKAFSYSVWSIILFHLSLCNLNGRNNLCLDSANKET